MSVAARQKHTACSEYEKIGNTPNVLLLLKRHWVLVVHHIDMTITSHVSARPPTCTQKDTTGPCNMCETCTTHHRHPQHPQLPSLAHSRAITNTSCPPLSSSSLSDTSPPLPHSDGTHCFPRHPSTYDQHPPHSHSSMPSCCPLPGASHDVACHHAVHSFAWPCPSPCILASPPRPLPPLAAPAAAPMRPLSLAVPTAAAPSTTPCTPSSTSVPTSNVSSSVLL